MLLVQISRLTIQQLNIIRCFVLPVAYGIFLAVAQLFLFKPNNVGSRQLYEVDIEC